MIVDSVLAIRKGLTGSDQKFPTVSIETKDSIIANGITNTDVRAEVKSPKIVDTINGVPIYADGGFGSSTAAIFS